MKVSLQWLKELVDIGDMPVKVLAHRLTMAGLEVEEIAPVAGDFSGIVVGHVKSVAPHPNADKLRVTRVDAGTGELLDIVCGAPNVAEGQKVPCALIGAKLPSSRSGTGDQTVLEIKKANYLETVKRQQAAVEAQVQTVPGEAPDETKRKLSRRTPIPGEIVIHSGVAREVPLPQ